MAKDEEIQGYIEDIFRYQTDTWLKEGSYVDDEYFKTIYLPLDPKLNDCNRMQNLLKTMKYVNRDKK